MNIIHIVPHYPPSLGGMEVVAQELAERQAKAGHTVTVLTSSNAAKAGVEKPHPNLTVKRLRYVEIAHTPIIPGIFFGLLRAQKPAVVHLHVAMAATPEMTAIASLLRGIPYIVHFHLDVGPLGTFAFLLPTYKQHFLGRVMRNAQMVVSLADSHQKFIAQTYKVPRHKLRVIPNGVGEEYFLPAKKKANKKPVIFFVGRLSVQKDIPMAIKAVAQMKTDVTFRIAGDGDQLNELKQLIAEIKSKRITLIGPKRGAEKLEEYRRSDICLMTSEREGMPISALEAMAAGHAMIVSDIDGLRETVGEDGILVKPRTAAAFTKALDSVAGNAKRLTELQARSRKRAKQYTWQKVCNAFEQLYTEALNAR